MNTKLHAYIELIRPFTLLAPLIVSSSVMIASLISQGNTTFTLSTLLTILPASICFVLLNGASNILNQATDHTEDALSKPYRPLPKGDILQKEAYNLSLLLYSLAILLSLTIHILFSFFILLISFFSITYSLPPRIKQILFINQLWVSIPRGLLGILASWSVFGDPFQPLPLSIGTIALIFLFGGTATKDMLDSEADKHAGTKTLINTYGIKKTALISYIFMTTAFILIIPLILLDILNPSLLPLTLLTILCFIIFWQMTNTQKNKKYENTTAWTLMYTTYFIYALSFAFITIMFS